MSMKNGKVVRTYASNLEHRINNLKRLEYSDNYIYESISSDLGVIVSILSEKNRDLTLNEMEPIIKVFTEFKKEYLGE